MESPIDNQIASEPSRAHPASASDELSQLAEKIERSYAERGFLAGIILCDGKLITSPEHYASEPASVQGGNIRLRALAQALYQTHIDVESVQVAPRCDVFRADQGSLRMRLYCEIGAHRRWAIVVFYRECAEVKSLARFQRRDIVSLVKLAGRGPGESAPGPGPDDDDIPY